MLTSSNCPLARLRSRHRVQKKVLSVLGRGSVWAGGMPPRVRLHDWGAPLNTWRTTRKPASAGLGARARDQAGQREPEILGLEYPGAGGGSHVGKAGAP